MTARLWWFWHRVRGHDAYCWPRYHIEAACNTCDKDWFRR